jgi:NAD(P)H dehydrogenase (quinone)
MIAITGANGNLGQAVLNFLIQKTEAANITAVVRNPKNIENFEAKGIIVRQADYNDINSLVTAFKGVDNVLQISTIGVDIETANQQEKNVVDAMVANDVKHIFYTSMVQAKPNTIFKGTTTQFNTERLIKKSNIDYTIFRNSMYMEAIPDLIGEALQTGQINYPAGQGKVSFVSRLDIAEAISIALTNDGHQNKIYEITGDKAYSFSEIADLLASEKDIHSSFTDITENDLREQLISYQMSLEVIDLLISMANGIKAGEFSFVDDSLETLLKRKPLTLQSYLKGL